MRRPWRKEGRGECSCYRLEKERDARVFRLGDRRGEATETREGGFRIIIAETRGECVIAITWPNQKVGRKQDGPKR
jgi:hypothetical protein